MVAQHQDQTIVPKTYPGVCDRIVTAPLGLRHGAAWMGPTRMR
ncbi:MAG: hypothetical protein AVDCRST_MAG77-2513 [uncultured Chloroflexi bacterium]|uniref:Uncharacterized protein n=1 Tax=uncultured Chloroflexota bacterium TaxID=166587 RepID=A0A6J4IRQ6_9CHLR|nr:MAG: hypothetical protein AVDCRST_MAG77-2513 [uncultured Chloroflexota bacterium]